jgi:hypothetical protein
MIYYLRIVNCNGVYVNRSSIRILIHIFLLQESPRQAVKIIFLIFSQMTSSISTITQPIPRKTEAFLYTLFNTCMNKVEVVITCYCNITPGVHYAQKVKQYLFN